MMTELSDVVVRELEKVARSGPSNAEVNRAKAQLKAGLLMGLESSSMRAEQMARHLIVHDRLIPTEELVAGVDNVGVEDIAAFSRRLMKGAPSIVVAGSGRRSRTEARHLAQQLSGTVG